MGYSDSGPLHFGEARSVEAWCYNSRPMKTSRRMFALSLIFAAAALFSSPEGMAQKSGGSSYLIYVGTYTTKQTSKGIYAYRFDSTTGQLASLGLAGESTDPSFVAVHPNGKYLYAVNEIGDFNGMKSGAVSAFAIDRKSGTLKLLNQVSTHGAGPCFVSLDKSGRFVLVANYDGGSVATFVIQDDGSLSLVKGFVQHSGSGVDKERQEGPHAHWIGVSPDNRFALVADLGLDDVMVYKLDDVRGGLTPNSPPFSEVKPGSGPRHLAFHPNGKFAYLVSEMSSTVTAFAYSAQKGSLSTLQTLPMLPKDYSGVREAAEIVVHPSGNFLYASNRGTANSIAAYKIDTSRGTLTLAGMFSTKGQIPRNFVIDPTGQFLLVANEDSGNIVVFRIDAATGALTPTGKVEEVPAPVCITFVPAE
jgi:6-phosphogluconolactonase